MPRWLKGFTLIEMIVTLAILGVLATIVFPMGKLTIQRQKEHELRQRLREIRTAIDTYKQAVDEGKIMKSANESGYPKNLRELVDGVVNARDPKSNKIYFLREIPRDPFADKNLPPETTWALRSYESPPDHPKEGEDVFDVHSKSQAIAIDGTPYREW